MFAVFITGPMAAYKAGELGVVAFGSTSLLCVIAALLGWLVGVVVGMEFGEWWSASPSLAFGGVDQGQ